MSDLSYLSTLNDVINCSEDDLKRNIGYLNPDTVIQYIFYLRAIVYSQTKQIDDLKQASHGGAKPFREPGPSKPSNEGAKPSGEPGTSKPAETTSVTVGLLGFHDNKYISIQPDGQIIINRVQFNRWEHLTLEFEDENYLHIKSCHGKYLHPKSDGSIRCDRHHKEGETRLMRVYADSKIGLKTFAGKYLSAQPNGRLEANRDHFKAWEMFEVVFLDVKTCFNLVNYRSVSPNSSGESQKFGKFPDIQSSFWIWGHNGSNQNGSLFFENNGVRWSNGNVQGSWKLKKDGTELFTRFNNTDHTLKYDVSSQKAILITPVRNPPSVMWVAGPVPPDPRTPHLLPHPLSCGDKVVAYGRYADGNPKFSVNIVKEPDLKCLNLHVDFRPPHNVVMNNRVNGAWQAEVRVKCPNFTDKEIFEVIIYCESKNYKVIFDGKELDAVFPYRNDLSTGKTLLFHEGGANGFRWLFLSPVYGTEWDGKFPDVEKKTWQWCHNGWNVTGRLNFHTDGQVAWNGGEPHGSWSICGGILVTNFNNVDHRLRWDWKSNKAILLSPSRVPASTMHC